MTAGQATIVLPADLQEIIDMTYSLVLPTTAGAVIYNISLLDEDNFMYAAAYQPANTGGQPQVAFIQSDISGQITLQLFPFIPSNGFFNIYYKQRPILWATPPSTDVSTLDSTYQEAAILWACAEVCEARQRATQSKMFWDRYEAQLEKMRATIRKRTRPRVGQVRDVTGTVFNIPYWYSMGRS